MDKPESLSSAETDVSSRWPEIARLGKTIAREFGESADWRTLPRWMSFRIAELIKRAEESEGNESEAAKKEADDLILRLWQMREKWPQGAPMEYLAAALRKLEPAYLSNKPKVALDDWAALIAEFDLLGDEDRETLLDAFTSQLDLGAQERWIEEAGDQLDDREREIFAFFKARHAKLQARKSFAFDNSKDILEMSDAEIRYWVKKRLEENVAKRGAAIKLATTRARRPKKQPEEVTGFEDDEQ